MSKATVRIVDNTDTLFHAMRARTMAALAEAAEAGRAVFDEKATGITEATIVPPRANATGYSAGIRARNGIWRVFDKGSLGKRTARLKRPNQRKETWDVVRRGTKYTAHRREVAGKGIAPRNIANPARLAGKKALRAALRI